MPSPIQRFWKKVNKTETCWIWLGAKDEGYGRILVNGKRMGAHRFSYELFVGAIPNDMVIDHLCRVRECVNPCHMRVVTNIENVMAGMSPMAISARKVECMNKHAFTRENTRIDKRGRRSCRICARDGLRLRRKLAKLGG